MNVFWSCHAIYVDKEGNLYAAGDNKYGQCGIGEAIEKPSENPIIYPIKENFMLLKRRRLNVWSWTELMWTKCLNLNWWSIGRY